MRETKKRDYDGKKRKNHIELDTEYKPRITVNRASKDSVFTDLFSYPEYLLELYKSLFPEDKECKKEDLEILSLGNLFLNGSYNDLGFLVKDRLLILVEAQSTWNPNIPMRMLNYLVYTYREYEYQHGFNKYGSKLEHYPQPELYVVYTGSNPEVPNKLHLKDCFVLNSSSDEVSVDCTVNVINSTNSSGILTEYISFCKIFNDMVKRYGYKFDAIKETI